jgi:predicted permease
MMVVVQIAVTLASLVSAGLVIQSLRNVLRVDPGFTTEGILTVDVSLSPGRYSSRETRAAFVQHALERIENVPGVVSAGFINRLPFSGVSVTTGLVPEGTERVAIPMIERPQADVRSVDEGYFRTLGVPVLGGELFRGTDANRPVAVLSATMASLAWPGEHAIGKRFQLFAQPNRLIEVIGVVGNVRNMGFEAGQSRTVYLPYWQGFLGTTSFAVRTQTEPAEAATAVRAAISDIDRNVPIDSVRTMQGVVSGSLASRTFQVTSLTLFGVVALALAAIGVFGVVSYSVRQRSKELGIRLALGATPRILQWMVVSDLLRLVGTGLVLGMPLAIVAGVVIRDALFGVDPLDPRTLLAAAAVMVLVASVGGLIPARRATRIDPIATLRAE